MCEFSVGDAVLGRGSVRSFYISGAAFTEPPDDRAHHVRKTGLAEMMAVEPDGPAVLRQHADPVLGVAATGLELVAAAAVNNGRLDAPPQTGSLRVTYLRRLTAGGQCRSTATASHIGRNTGVADAQAFGANGRLVLTARFTGYR